jgi:hypothetical protein
MPVGTGGDGLAEADRRAGNRHRGADQRGPALVSDGAQNAQVGRLPEEACMRGPS